MKPVNAKLIYNKEFIANTKDMRDWINENVEDGKGYEFVIELEKFILSKIITFPTHYPEWKWKRTNSKLYRRVVFNKNILSFSNSFQIKLKCLLFIIKIEMYQMSNSNFPISHSSFFSALRNNILVFLSVNLFNYPIGQPLIFHQ